MEPLNRFGDDVFNIKASNFNEKALELFNLQYHYNPVYRKFTDLIGRDPSQVNDPGSIPFLPVELFRTQRIYIGEQLPELLFESSGTTDSARSRHYVADSNIYRRSLLNTFSEQIAPPESLCILGLLPSYLEQKRSSLIWMCRELMQASGHPLNGFYLYDYEKLAETLKILKESNQRTLLIGVSFALLDFAEIFQGEPGNVMIMETGGMKGRRKELTREELHAQIGEAFGVNKVYSEYGMTELLSQSYSNGEGLFRSPEWMRILTRDIYDPLDVNSGPGSGAVNIIDLANIWSCAFLSTSDLGRVHGDGNFEILGRLDNSEIRGCNLLVA